MLFPRRRHSYTFAFCPHKNLIVALANEILGLAYLFRCQIKDIKMVSTDDWARLHGVITRNLGKGGEVGWFTKSEIRDGKMIKEYSTGGDVEGTDEYLKWLLQE